MIKSHHFSEKFSNNIRIRQAISKNTRIYNMKSPVLIRTKLLRNQTELIGPKVSAMIMRETQNSISKGKVDKSSAIRKPTNDRDFLSDKPYTHRSSIETTKVMHSKFDTSKESRKDVSNLHKS